jgi:hypothetical protein
MEYAPVVKGNAACQSVQTNPAIALGVEAFIQQVTITKRLQCATLLLRRIAAVLQMA